MERAYQLAYGHNIPAVIGGRDHYSSELVLLYCITLASQELSIFGRMATRTPRLRLARWDVVEDEVSAARADASHFWFLSGEPHFLDRINEVHTRLARRKHPWSVPPVQPTTLPKERVRYYTNPLARLVELHRGWRELTTGLGFQSPFPRPDATSRI